MTEPVNSLHRRLQGTFFIFLESCKHQSISHIFDHGYSTDGEIKLGDFEI